MATINFISYTRQSRSALEHVAAYVSQGTKTESGKLLSGQSCLPSLAAKEFVATRQTHRKESPVWFYHYTQSFHPNEAVTGKLAHQIAKEFAVRAWPNSEVLIATHTDAAHIHSHFLVNAVCQDTGKMLRQGPNTLKYLRSISDEICQKYKLSVLQDDTRKSSQGMGTREYRSAAKGESWKLQMMCVIDDCMYLAGSREDFIRRMEQKGYHVRWETERKYITYTTPGGKKCRDNKLHEEKYRKEIMEDEFKLRSEIIAGRAAAAQSAAAGPRTGAKRKAADHTSTAGSSDAANDKTGEHNSKAASGDDGCDPAAGVYRETGWEHERETFLALASAGNLPSMDLAVGNPDFLRLMGAGIQLAEAAGSVLVTTPDDYKPAGHTDKKLHQKIREKKIAHGQKSDDNENEDFEITM